MAVMGPDYNWFSQNNEEKFLELSQAAACDGTTITTSANGQAIMPGTLPTF